MRSMRLALSAFMLMLAAADIAAQPRRPGVFEPSRRLFAGLFRGDSRMPPRVVPARALARERQANRECEGCADRPGRTHLLMDSPRLSDTWLSRHTYQANGGSFGDNAAVADFWYDAVHRRLFSRSLVLHEVDDPADLRLGRAPGVYPDELDFSSTLQAGTTVGHVGFVRWTRNGFGSYFAAIQGAVRDEGTGYLDLATVTGSAGTTRTGSRYSPEDLIKHVRLHPSGQLEVGFETAVDARPDPLLHVRGDTVIEGTLTVGDSVIGGPQPVPALACSIRTGAGGGRQASAACGSGELATGGGGACASGEMRGSQPRQAAGAPTGWEINCSRNGAHTAYAVCCAMNSERTLTVR